MILGPVVGIGAVKAVLSHCTIIVESFGSLMVAGPPIVAHATHEQLSKRQLGGVGVSDESGAVDVVVQSEAEAFAVARRLLSMLPERVGQRLPFQSNYTAHNIDQMKSLRDMVSRQSNQPFDIRNILKLIVDM